MERGVIAGGVLISASFLTAVWLNHSALEETRPPVAAAPVRADAACPPAAQQRRVTALQSTCAPQSSGVGGGSRTLHHSTP